MVVVSEIAESRRSSDAETQSTQEQGSVFAETRYERGRWDATLGLRADLLAGHGGAVALPANPVFPDVLPAVTIPAAPSVVHWRDLLPRASLRYRLHDRLTVGAGYARLAGPLSSGVVTFDAPGRDGASAAYFWRDRNGNHIVERGEVEEPALDVSGLDPDRPGEPVRLHRIDPELRAPLTDELRLEARLERRTFTGDLIGYYRHHHRRLWNPLQGLTGADYAIRGAVRGELFGTPYSTGYYAPVSVSRLAPENGRELQNRGGYFQDTWGVELAVAATLGRARLRLWGALSDWREWFPDRDRATQDPTSTDDEPQQDGQHVAARASGLGRGDIFVNALWSGGAALALRLPARFDVHALAQARHGFPIPYFQEASTGDPTAGIKRVLVAERLDRYRLPTVFTLDLRAQRPLPIRRGTLLATIDVFNAPNRATTLQVSRDVELPAFSRAREVLRPRLVRVGLEYTF
jgi:hypothetical protein